MKFKLIDLDSAKSLKNDPIAHEYTWEYPDEDEVCAAESKLLEGNALSRLYRHLNNDDKTNFAIVGSLDKDDIELSHAHSLLKEIFNLIDNHKDVYSNRTNVSYKPLEGTYTMESGEVIIESSYVIYNISKEEAVELGKKINQESIIWKDSNFFGFVYMDGNEDNCFTRDELEFSKEQLEKFASRLLSNHVEGKIRFSFKLEELLENNTRGAARLKEQSKYDTIFEFKNY